MLFTKEFKAGIRAGRITCSFRSWKKPQAKPGGRYNLAPLGSIEVSALTQIRAADISDRDARTVRALQLIRDRPGTRASDLAPEFGWDIPTFKRQIRKLKALGLTDSLETGYRIAPRGEQVPAQKQGGHD